MAAQDMRNRKNVIVGKPDVEFYGGIRIGDPVTKKAQIPTTARGELDASLNAQPGGFIGQDGVTKIVDKQVEKIKDWNGDVLLAVTAEHEAQVKLKFEEGLNVAVLKTLAGEDNVTVEAGKITVNETSDESPHRSFDFLMVGNDNTDLRLFVPDGNVTTIGEVKFVRSGTVSYEVTIECFPVEKTKMVLIAESDDIKAPAATPGSP